MNLILGALGSLGVMAVLAYMVVKTGADYDRDLNEDSAKTCNEELTV